MTTLIPRMRTLQRAQSSLSLSVRELDKNASKLAQNVASLDYSKSARQSRLLLLSTPTFLYGSQTLHALDPGLDALCAGAFARGTNTD